MIEEELVDAEARAPEGAESSSREMDAAGALTRRAFVENSAFVAGGVVVLGAVAPAADAKRVVKAATKYKPKALSRSEFSTLEAALDRMFPADHLGPGAVESRVAEYIDKALAKPYKAELPLYKSLLRALNTAAGSHHKHRFASLSARQQDELLTKFEAGKAPGASPTEQTTLASAFSALVQHMREGMFADPMYGGNKNLAGWKLLKYPDAVLVVSAKQQDVNAKPRKPTGKTAGSYGGTPYDGPSL